MNSRHIYFSWLILVNIQGVNLNDLLIFKWETWIFLKLLFDMVSIAAKSAAVWIEDVNGHKGDKKEKRKKTKQNRN